MIGEGQNYLYLAIKINIRLENFPSRFPDNTPVVLCFVNSYNHFDWSLYIANIAEVVVNL